MAVTVLAFEDFAFDEWPDVDLAPDRDSARKFWFILLQFALADSAKAIRFRSHFGEDCISCEVGDREYEFEPLPEAYRRWFYNAGREILAGSVIRAWTWRLIVPLLRCSMSRQLVTVMNGTRIVWMGVYSPDGITFRPMQAE